MDMFAPKAPKKAVWGGCGGKECGGSSGGHNLCVGFVGGSMPGIIIVRNPRPGNVPVCPVAPVLAAVDNADATQGPCQAHNAAVVERQNSLTVTQTCGNSVKDSNY